MVWCLLRLIGFRRLDPAREWQVPFDTTDDVVFKKSIVYVIFWRQREHLQSLSLMILEAIKSHLKGSNWL